MSRRGDINKESHCGTQSNQGNIPGKFKGQFLKTRENNVGIPESLDTEVTIDLQ